MAERLRFLEIIRIILQIIIFGISMPSISAAASHHSRRPNKHQCLMLS